MNTKLAIQCGQLISQAYQLKTSGETNLRDSLYAKPAGLEASIEYFGLVTNTNEGYFIAIPGTVTLHDWESNFNVRTVPYILDGAEVTEGVVDLAMQLETQIAKVIPRNKPVYISGHSLGAAIAETIYLRSQKTFAACYSFAAPKSRTAQLTTYQFYRIFNTKDVVPDLPPFMNLVHSGIEIPLTFNKNSIEENHAIDNYVEVLHER